MNIYVLGVLFVLIDQPQHVVQFAVEAAITILRIDDMINIAANPEDDMEG